jgi:pimeloyl-ACP methyl ester carboxylesterase
VFDKAGVGLSDPVPHVRTIEDRVAEIEAVMDAVSFGSAVLFGFNDGGLASIVFAATRPERTRALILADSHSFLGAEGWDDVECDPADLWARNLPEQGENYMPSVEQITRMQEIGRAVRSAWGSGAVGSISAPSVRSIRQLAMLERMCASPGIGFRSPTSSRPRNSTTWSKGRVSLDMLETAIEQHIGGMVQKLGQDSVAPSRKCKPQPGVMEDRDAPGSNRGSGPVRR